MNYIWELIVLAQQAGMDKKELRFACAESFSPYMELSLPLLNAHEVEPDAEINPYYRFHDVFEELCDVENTDDAELRGTLFDIAVHFLGNLDVLQGMNKREFYTRFLVADMENGLFGETIQERIRLFSAKEKDIIGLHLLRCYETGEAEYMWKETVKRLFPGILLYAKSNSEGEFLLYLGRGEDNAVKERLQLLQELFLPLSSQVELFWSDHIGVIGVAETMRLGESVLY
ncbi:iron-dependent peroxidase [Paenibacillus hexagrammi]|uniref:Iron-dependent peroxidase n=1 Tax=Paenibacillus hexagrammi TaxID=2908839 RepID=A0ABY3SGJ2_9BACL|nr:iron-dependent peroxidase [Paenibacillus sp. YPD9-1]UJF32215.1 iron-dependent peroxidase [Paenibacillus sp. YPD9-1]